MTHTPCPRPCSLRAVRTLDTDEQKKQWLEEVSVFGIPEGMEFYRCHQNENIMFYSREYLEKASLEELQARHGQNVDWWN